MGRHSCCHKQKLKKGLWSPEEDEKLVRYITKHGHGCWSAVPKQAGTWVHHSTLHNCSCYMKFCVVYLVARKFCHFCANFRSTDLAKFAVEKFKFQ